MMSSLQHDIRQLYSHGVLDRFERLEEADVSFTYSEADIFLSAFNEAMTHIESTGFLEKDPDLAVYARIFENFVVSPVGCISTKASGIVSAALYWLAGYSANSFLVAKAVLSSSSENNKATGMLLQFLAKQLFNSGQIASEDSLEYTLRDYFETGDPRQLQNAIKQNCDLMFALFKRNLAEEYLAAELFDKVLNRLKVVSIWESIRGKSSASMEGWQLYMQTQMQMDTPIIDLWPSQRRAIDKGLLDGKSTVVLKMPTSAGKTKMTELTFVNDLLMSEDRKCLYIAPFRALVSEVEKELGKTFSSLNIPTVSLYGGSDANMLEAELSVAARVVIATPEKIKAVLNLSGGKLSDFGTVVLDEGHLLDSLSRGAAYELQLARLRQDLGENNRTIFLSAVLPNSDEIAAWLGGSSEFLAEDSWQPTSTRTGVVTWPSGGNARLKYIAQAGQQFVDQFFVPRILEEEVWKERHPVTGYNRTHRFPSRGDKGTIAAALSFKHAKDGPVILYTSRPDWAESIAQKILSRISLEREIETNLVDDENARELHLISEYLTHILGEHSILPKAVANGFAFHHGQVPQGIRLILEEEFRKQTFRLLIATNTLAQGVNLPAKSVIVHSLPTSDAPIRDFWNLAGRAGRALKESEGEVIILQTGSLSSHTIKKFLDKGQIETAYSHILYLVYKVIMEHSVINEGTLNAFLSTDESQEEFAKTLDSLDMHLIEILAEDMDMEREDSVIEELIHSLLATYQAESIDLENGTSLKESVATLVQLRADYVRGLIPDHLQRKRYARAGVSAQSCILLDSFLGEILDILRQSAEMNEEVFSQVIQLTGQLKEMKDVDVSLAIRLGYQWINMGTYADLFESNEEDFSDYGELIRFVENVLCYKTPWVLNALVRLIESTTSEDENTTEELAPCPDWFLQLPQMLSYGVQTKELLWVMSMGIQDREFAKWLLDAFYERNRRMPRSFRDFVIWAVNTKDDVMELMVEKWPQYFRRLYTNIVDRYQQMSELLSDQ